MLKWLPIFELNNSDETAKYKPVSTLKRCRINYEVWFYLLSLTANNRHSREIKKATKEPPFYYLYQFNFYAFLRLSTPIIRLAVDTMLLFSPKTAARTQPKRYVSCAPPPLIHQILPNVEWVQLLFLFTNFLFFSGQINSMTTTFTFMRPNSFSFNLKASFFQLQGEFWIMPGWPYS